MVPLVLQTPTDVARASSTLAWASPSNVLSTSVYTTTGNYLPGIIADYLKVSIAAPSPPLGSLPTTLLLSLNGYLTTVGTFLCDVIDDVIQLGKTTPLGTNAAQNLSWGGAPTVRQWNVPTDGITLADLNAGLIFVFLGFKAYPFDSHTYDSGNWTITYTASGQSDNNGTIVAWVSGPGPFTSSGSGSLPRFASANGTITPTATWIGGGSAPTYVPLSVRSQESATASLVPAPGGTSSCTATVTDGFGNTDSEAGSTVDAELDTTRKVRATVIGSVAIYPLTVTSIASSISSSPPVTGTPDRTSVNVTAAVANPDATILHLNSMTLSAGSGTGGGGPTIGHGISNQLQIWPQQAGLKVGR